MLALPDSWVWDFWTADDGELFHLFYLHAPKSLGNLGNGRWICTNIVTRPLEE